jgi:hypothetical protein
MGLVRRRNVPSPVLPILSISRAPGSGRMVGLTFPNPPLEPASDHVNAEDRDGMSRQTR